MVGAARFAGESGPSMGRLVGVDLARALAVFGMFAVHVGPIEAAPGDVGGWFRSLSEGRPSALFAMLAGFSLMLIAGRFEPKTGVAGRQAKLRSHAARLRAGIRGRSDTHDRSAWGSDLG